MSNTQQAESQANTSQEETQTLEALQKMKHPITKGLDVTHLSATERHSMKALLDLFVPQHKQLKTGINFLFFLAGLLWIPIFFAKSFSIPQDVFVPFRLNQVRLYVILMSLWGFHKYRCFAQVSTLLQLAVRFQKPWYQLELRELKEAGKRHAFDWLRKSPDSESPWIHRALMWLFIVLSAIQIGRQIWLLFR